MLTRQKVELYGPWQLLPPVKQLTPTFVQVPHQGDVSPTLYAAVAQSWQSDWQVWSVGLGVGLAVGLMVGRGVAAAGLAWAGLGAGPGTQSSSMRSDAIVSLRDVRHKLGRFVARETRRPQMTQINTMILKISGRRGKDCGFPRPGDAHPVGVA